MSWDERHGSETYNSGERIWEGKNLEARYFRGRQALPQREPYVARLNEEDETSEEEDEENSGEAYEREAYEESVRGQAYTIVEIWYDYMILSPEERERKHREDKAWRKMMDEEQKNWKCPLREQVDRSWDTQRQYELQLKQICEEVITPEEYSHADKKRRIQDLAVWPNYYERVE
jgi:hypothetical protein